MIAVTLDRPWLVAELGRPHRILSWSLNRPGYAMAHRVVWREVRNADLPVSLDVRGWFRDELSRAGLPDAVGMLTSRDIARHTLVEARAEDTSAEALATVGLSNAERIGSRIDREGQDWGTINVCAVTDRPLTDGALAEALSLAAAARTAAVMELGPDIGAGRATGTGTDCIAMAAPHGDTAYAGMHTALGEALGRAVYDAVALGVADWMAEMRPEAANG